MKNQIYKCSVLMSTYNGDQYIAQQIDSILNQKNVHVNILIRDDGSTDNTTIILHDYENRYKNNISIIYGENVGIHKSYAELIESVLPDEYVAFSDQDDVWDCDKLLIAINNLHNENASFYCSASRLVDNNLKSLHRTTASLKKTNYYMKSSSKILTPGVQGCTIVLTRELFNNSRINYPSIYGHDTWLTVVAFYSAKCYYDATPHMNYRQHNNSWTGNRENKVAQLKREYLFFIHGMCRYSDLADKIILQCNNSLTNKNRELLILLSKDKKNLSEKIKLIVYPGFHKYGILQDLIFKLCILNGKV